MKSSGQNCAPVEKVVELKNFMRQVVEDVRLDYWFLFVVIAAECMGKRGCHYGILCRYI